MRPIGTLSSESDATRFGDYLLSIGLRNHVEPSASSSDWLIWIEHDDHVEQGQLRLREFLANPNDPRYDDVRARARALRIEAERAALRRQKNFTEIRTSWANVPRFATPVTLTVIVLCLGVFALQQTKFAPDIARWMLFYTPLWLRQPTLGDLARELGFATADASSAFSLRDAFSLIGQGQLWRLVTPALMHANIGHILFNLWAFANVGAIIESRKGAGVMLALVLLGAAFSCTGQAAWDGLTPRGGMGFVGLSGVVYATFGYAWIRGRLAPQERVGLNQQTVGMMLAWLVLCMTGIVGPIANAAHLVGLLVGVAIGYAPVLRRRIKLG
jgi:GlpG protein